jgi:hypothetical protein
VLGERRNAKALKDHPDHLAAKDGDAEAAIRLVPELVGEATIAAARERLGNNVI